MIRLAENLWPLHAPGRPDLGPHLLRDTRVRDTRVLRGQKTFNPEGH